MEQRDLVRHALTVLELMGLPYCVVGSFACVAYSHPRMTHDLDIVVEIPPPRVKELCAQFPDPEWYVNEQTACEAVFYRRPFNVIHMPSGGKIDFMMARNDEWGRLQLARCRREPVLADFDAYVAHPEDVILGKLLYYKEGGSEKHIRDIAGILQISGELIDRDRVAGWADKLGVRDEWEHILTKMDGAAP